MRIAVGIPAYNESVFIEQSVRNCIDVGYDHVVYLDDGSTDDTYEKLVHYTKDYDHITVIKNKENSVFSNTGNRWEIVVKECAKFNPDWIMVRAADECLSYPAFSRGEDLLRRNIEGLDAEGVNMLIFPYVHLWRSPWWYRVDGFWGGCYRGGSISAWKNNTGWEFKYGSGIHLGSHRPNSMKVKDISRNINNYNVKEKPIKILPIVVLHYGMASHEFIANKLDYQISTAMKIKSRAIGIPAGIPTPRAWNRFNGYKVAYELGLDLKKVESIWYENDIPDVDKPKVESLYNVIAKYNKNRADEYAKIYGR
jgi:glycosyltransferase involved in cell wall biosynthesis